MSVILLRGDARELPLPDESVDLVLCSPPYFGQRDYRDGNESLKGQLGSEETPREYITNLLDCTREWVRVLKPGGSIFVNLGDKYAGGGGQWENDERPDPHRRRAVTGKIATHGKTYGFKPKSLIGLPSRYILGCIDDLGLILRRDIIWSKLSALPESVADRCATRHEYIFHLTRQGRHFAAVDEIREPHAEVSVRRAMPHRSPPGRRPARIYAGQPEQTLRLDQMNHPTGKLPGSVWEIAATPLFVPDRIAHAECCGDFKREGCEDGLEHHAAFPLELARKCILGWSPVGGIVVDPFGGTGAAALVADVLCRVGISADLSMGYCRLARWRTTDPGERARAMQVPKPPPVPDGQVSLFEVTG